MTPTQRSLELLRSLGWTVAVVERWNPWAHIRQDLYGWVDLVAIRPQTNDAEGGGVMFVQTTTRAHQQERRHKIEAQESYTTAKLAGVRVELHGWSKVGAKGKRKVWTAHREEM